MRIIVDEVNQKHVRCRLFMTNALNGRLCFDHEEWGEFQSIIECEILYRQGVNYKLLEAMMEEYEVIGFVTPGSEIYCTHHIPDEAEKVTAASKTDVPNHCPECERLIPEKLTDDGRSYVREQVLRYQNEGRGGHPDSAGRAVILESWAREWPDIEVWVARSGLRGYLPNNWGAVESEDAAISSLDQTHDLTDQQKTELRNGGQCDLEEDQGADYAEVEKMNISELEY